VDRRRQRRCERILPGHRVCPCSADHYGVEALHIWRFDFGSLDDVAEGELVAPETRKIDETRLLLQLHLAVVPDLQNEDPQRRKRILNDHSSRRTSP
jgi:hypothetical protein